jgi:hypothetical protein
MATFEVEKDGQTYEVDAPDDINDHDLKSVLAKAGLMDAPEPTLMDNVKAGLDKVAPGNDALKGSALTANPLMTLGSLAGKVQGSLDRLGERVATTMASGVSLRGTGMAPISPVIPSFAPQANPNGTKFNPLSLVLLVE